MESKKIINLEEVASFVAFDIFLCNVDRNDGNSILVAIAGKRTKYRYLLIDHGWCFNGPGWNAKTMQSLPYKLGGIPWKREGVTKKSQFSSTVEKLVSLNKAEIDSLLQLLPVEWGITSNETDALKHSMTNREQDSIMGVIIDNKKKFPNWRN